ncbi:HAMP domain-containing protein [Acidithiobacillus ferrivorans]|nr:HAMP domain-containing protein [Acidithiobacillus ferrivorans]
MKLKTAGISFTTLVQTLRWSAIVALIIITSTSTWALSVAEHSGEKAMQESAHRDALVNFQGSEDATISLINILATEQEYEPVVYLALQHSNKKISSSFSRLQHISPKIANSLSGPVKLLEQASSKVLLFAATIRQPEALASYQSDFHPKVLRFNAIINHIVAQHEQLSKESIQQNATMNKHVMLMIVVIGIASIFLVFVFGTIIVRSVVQKLQRISKAIQRIASGDLNAKVPVDTSGPLGEIAQATNQMGADLSTLIKGISFTAKQIADTCEQLSSATASLTNEASDTSTQTSQASESMSNMSATSNRVAQDAEDISKIANTTAGATQQGNAAIGSSLEELSSAGTAIINMAQQVQKLEESSHQIGSIVSTIKEITAKTNLLALNAAIESARAGEHGRGFAVVADEVRNLANGTADAAEDVAEKILHIQTQMQSFSKQMFQASAQVSHGTEMAGDSLQRLGSINKSISDISERVADVATSAEDLRNVAKAISENIVTISQKTLSINNEIEATQGQIAMLRDESQRLMQLTGKFQII